MNIDLSNYAGKLPEEYEAKWILELVKSFAMQREITDQGTLFDIFEEALITARNAIIAADENNAPRQQYVKAAVRADLTNYFNKYDRHAECRKDVAVNENDEGKELEDAIEANFETSLFSAGLKLDEEHQLALRLATIDAPELERYLEAFLATNGSDRKVAKVMKCSDKTVAKRYRLPLAERVQGIMLTLKGLRK